MLCCVALLRVFLKRNVICCFVLSCLNGMFGCLPGCLIVCLFDCACVGLCVCLCWFVACCANCLLVRGGPCVFA